MVDKDPRIELLEKVEEAGIAMLTTAHPDGTLESRPMAVQEVETEPGVLWFITRASGDAAQDAEGRPVNVAVQDDGFWASVAGHGAIVRDDERKREYWNSATEAFFGEGAQPEDPEIVLVRVQAESAEYWDSGAASTVVELVKAKVTGGEARPAGPSHLRPLTGRAPRSEVLRQVRGRAGARDGHASARPVPREHRLRRAHPGLLGHGAHGRMSEDVTAAAERRVRHHGGPVPAGGLLHGPLLDERVHLDLVDGGGQAVGSERVQVLGQEVGHAPAPQRARRPRERSQGRGGVPVGALLGGAPRVRPMEEHEVHGVQAEPLE